MTEIQIIILLDIIIAINVPIQAIWIYLWLTDRKENKTNQLLANISNNQLDILSELLTANLTQENIRKNTFTYKEPMKK